MPLSVDPLTAVASAARARIVVGDSFAESNVDEGDAFEEFADLCVQS